eukprot:gene7245-4965_t
MPMLSIMASVITDVIQSMVIDVTRLYMNEWNARVRYT